jgi:DNA-binding NtrC family response regulator
MGSAKGTILVVEDEAGLRALIEQVLGAAGYSTLAASDGTQVLRVAEQYSGSIQLLLTDVTLTEMGGKEMAALLTALRPEMKVLFTSGHTRAAMIENGTLEPAANFIQKPWSPQGLCEKIGAVLGTQPSTTQASTHRILVVDDEAGMRDWLAAILEGCGHRVFIAKDGLEAQRLARRQALDLVITDISMPNEEGLGTICALRKAHPELKIIAMSGSNIGALGDATLLGAHASLAKPFTAEMVLKCIRDLLPEGVS